MQPQYTTPFKFFLEAIRPYKWWYLLMFQAPILGGFYNILYNYSIKLIVDNISTQSVFTVSAFALPIALAVFGEFYINFVWRLSNYAERKCEPFVRRNIICQVYDYVQHHSYKFFQDRQSGAIVSKAKGILDGYDNLFASLHHQFTPIVCNCVITAIALSIVSPHFSIFVIIWSILFVTITYKMSTRLNFLSNEISESRHNLFGKITDCITNIFTLFSFASRKRELIGIRQHLDSDFIPKDIARYKYDFKIQIVSSLLYIIILFSAIIYAIYLRYQGKITVGDFVFVMAMMWSFLDGAWRAVNELQSFIKYIGDLRASFEIMTLPQNSIDKPDNKEIHVSKGHIVLHDISFNYDGNKKVCEHLNLEIKPGQKVGLVGHSGAGKSTLIALLLKNFAITSGEIAIDGQSIYDVTSDSLRDNISLIPQDIMLFHRSIMENIRYGKVDASDEEVIAAAKAANIHDFIQGLAEGYNTQVGERGIKLSGGQRQRIAIARAILKNAPILILDEATSSLDTETEQVIQTSINTMLESNKATVIAIAHRLSTIKHMDRIIVMDNGKIIEDGSFQELVNKENGKFKALWDHQVNGMVV